MAVAQGRLRGVTAEASAAGGKKLKRITAYQNNLNLYLIFLLTGSSEYF